jgi:hypothetical protein
MMDDIVHSNGEGYTVGTKKVVTGSRHNVIQECSMHVGQLMFMELLRILYTNHWLGV